MIVHFLTGFLFFVLQTDCRVYSFTFSNSSRLFQYLADKRLPVVSNFYQPGQTVIAKVVEMKQNKKRFLSSLKMQDCYHGDTEIGLQMTLSYLQDRQKLLDVYSKSTGICVVILHSASIIRV